MMGMYEVDETSRGEEGEDEEEVDWREPPESYDNLLHRFVYSAPRQFVPRDTPWTRRIFELDVSREGNTILTANVLQKQTKYKPVDRKVRLVPSYMPNPEGQVFRPVVIGDLPPLPFNPPPLSDFVPSSKLSRERLEGILSRVPEGFLKPRELDLLVFVLKSREDGLAFEDSERRTFSSKYFDDYEIPVIEHTPWVQQPIRIPKAIEDQV